MKFVPGCGCCGVTVTITVPGCGLNLAGMTVVVKDAGGATVATGTTNTSGNYVTSLPPASGYTAQAGGGTTRFQSHTTTFTVTSTPGSVSVPLTVNTGYHCCACGTNTAAVYPNTLTITVATGTYTLTFGSPVLSAWGIAYTPTKPNTRSAATGVCGSHPIDVILSAKCTTASGSRVLQVSVTWSQPNPCVGGGCSDYMEAGTSNGSATATVNVPMSSCPTPLSASGTFPATVPNPGISGCTTNPTTLLCPEAGGFTITE